MRIQLLFIDNNINKTRQDMAKAKGKRHKWFVKEKATEQLKLMIHANLMSDLFSF